MFDPSDFLDVARELGKNNEARIRTTVVEPTTLPFFNHKKCYGY
jgi:hypothetical protein